MKKTTRKAKKAAKTPSELLLEAAIIWHAATFLSGQENTDSRADKMLRRAAVLYLKAGREVP